MKSYIGQKAKAFFGELKDMNMYDWAVVASIATVSMSLAGYSYYHHQKNNGPLMQAVRQSMQQTQVPYENYTLTKIVEQDNTTIYSFKNPFTKDTLRYIDYQEKPHPFDKYELEDPSGWIRTLNPSQQQILPLLNQIERFEQNSLQYVNRDN